MLAPVSMPPAWLDHDVAAVHRAALLLQLPEFAFFRLAYRRWHGRGVRDRELEPVFMSYLLRRRVPPWVRHLAREVQERNRAGVLVPQDYGIDPGPPAPTAVVEKRRRQLLLALAWGGFTAIALFALSRHRGARTALVSQVDRPPAAAVLQSGACPAAGGR